MLPMQKVGNMYQCEMHSIRIIHCTTLVPRLWESIEEQLQLAGYRWILPRNVPPSFFLGEHGTFNSE